MNLSITRSQVTALFLKVFLNAVAVLITAWILSGIRISDTWAAVGVATLLALINTFIRPFLAWITIPISLLTFGLFNLVINALIVILASRIISGFEVASFGAAFWFSILMTVIAFILSIPERIRSHNIVIRLSRNDDDNKPNKPDDFQDAEEV